MAQSGQMSSSSSGGGGGWRGGVGSGGGGADGAEKRKHNRSVVRGRFYDNESGAGRPCRPVPYTKIILNKSGTVGACPLLRQRVRVTAPLFSNMP